MITDIIPQLSREFVDDTANTNMYFGVNPDSVQRLLNLEKYFNYFATNIPQLILIGEAPGYRGCCVSGIPFTSTFILKNNPFFAEFDTKDFETQKEATATIIWKYFDEKGIYPLFWNAYPFHPHKSGITTSNRKPTKSELDLGRKYLNELIRMFPGAKLIAVGRVAQKSLETEGFVVEYVTHPSNGGKAKFISGMNTILADLK